MIDSGPDHPPIGVSDGDPEEPSGNELTGFFVSAVTLKMKMAANDTDQSSTRQSGDVLA